MKNASNLSLRLSLIVYIFSTLILSAQNFQGKITYERIYNDTKERKQLEDPDLDITERKKIEDGIDISKKFLERTFILEFNNLESIYKPIEELNLKPSDVDQFPFTDYYKNFKENYYMWKFDGFGAQLVVKDTMKVYNWKLIDETKKIGKYTCYKASFVQSVERNEQVKNEDGSFENVLELKDLNFIAWYTMEIPISNGPDRYGGLPGLILEVDEAGYQTIVATEIVLNPEKLAKIEPLRGKIVSPKGFEEKMGFPFEN
ncbi:GLPGLI family protein [Aureibaculum luteum]|uniref:GLPGLI family protein n=1 Tax=Aureibaculum luteum TaxID=1548456 RepID=UPI000E513D19|nr:GLPGLI family protein [Aureibaculum luteum]